MKSLLLRFLIVFTCFLCYRPVFGQIEFCRDARLLLETVGDRHVVAGTLHGHQKAWIRESMKALDRRGVYWLAGDEEDLAAFFSDFPAMASPGCKGFEAVQSRFEQRLSEVLALLDSLAGIPFDESLKQDSWLAGPDFSFPENAQERRQRWMARIQVRSLSDFFRTQQSPETLTKEEFLSSWEDLRNDNIRKLRCAVQQTLEPAGGLGETVARVMLNELLESFDPHSNFFSRTDQAMFEASLSTSSLSFGLDFRQNDQGEFEISSLDPGGSAWRSNLLNQGDVLVSIATPAGATLDLTCSTLLDLRMFVGQESAQTLVLEVRKETGDQQLVTLRKSRVKVDENVVTGFLLKGSQPVGYLYLPGFYTNWETDGQAAGLANDVAIELLRLKLEGAKGLIIDLRNNGGGAMREAIALAGIFIDQGPLCIVKERDGEPEVLKDFHRGVGYADPMVVMVNGYSASASELFAAAMQDYHRAVIVGDTTFGKATSQIMMPLGGSGGSPASGFMKLTTGEFLRVTGETHQQMGVIPDILFPELWEATMTRERQLPFSLTSEAVVPTKPFQALPPLPLQKLQTASTQRQAQSTYVRQLLDWQQKVPEMVSAVSRPELQFAGFREQFLARRNQIQALEALEEGHVAPFEVSNHRGVASLIRLDEARQAMNTQQISRIREDPEIAEAYQILADLLGTP